MRTREEALKYIDHFSFLAISDATSLVNSIYDTFEEVENDLRSAIDHYMEQTTIYKGALDRANERIAELEALEPKTCEGCEYLWVDGLGQFCDKEGEYTSNRIAPDYYELKDNA